MIIFVDTQVTVSPVSVYWELDKEDKCQIFQTVDLGKTFFVDNQLWDFDGKMWDEYGTPIKPPSKPQEKKIS